MRIAILVGGLPPAASGGTEIATLEIAREAARQGHDVHVVARDHLGQGKTVYKAQERGFRIHRITAPRFARARDLIYLLKGLDAVGRIQPDVVHAQAMYMCPAALLAKRLFGIPFIFYERGGVYMDWKHNAFFYPLFVRNADRVIAQTEYQRKALLKYYDREIEVIPNGVDCARFGTLTQAEARTRLNLQPDRKIVLSIGRARAEKNLSVFVKAANLDKTNNLYVLAGDGPELPQLRAMANGNVMFAGLVPRSDVPCWLAAADVYVNTSKSEGFPNSILEAMASGLPVVAPDITGMREIGFFGFLCRPNDPQSVAFAASGNFTGCGEANRRKAQEYTWENVVRRLYR